MGDQGPVGSPAESPDGPRSAPGLSPGCPRSVVCPTVCPTSRPRGATGSPCVLQGTGEPSQFPSLVWAQREAGVSSALEGVGTWLLRSFLPLILEGFGDDSVTVSDDNLPSKSPHGAAPHPGPNEGPSDLRRHHLWASGHVHGGCQLFSEKLSRDAVPSDRQTRRTGRGGPACCSRHPRSLRYCAPEETRVSRVTPRLP